MYQISPRYNGIPISQALENISADISYYIIQARENISADDWDMTKLDWYSYDPGLKKCIRWCQELTVYNQSSKKYIRRCIVHITKI